MKNRQKDRARSFISLCKNMKLVDRDRKSRCLAYLDLESERVRIAARVLARIKSEPELEILGKIRKSWFKQ